MADPTGGVDTALYRPAYDANGVLDVEGARPMAERDISFDVVVGWAHAPVRLAVPGIGDAGKDKVLDDLGTLDIVFGMAVTSRFSIGFDAGAYRTSTGAGYGVRGRFASGMVASPSTGLVSLRPLSNIDPSGMGANASLGDELAGPLDARVGVKYAFVVTPALALAAVATLVLPFGADDMLLGDEGVSVEPALALELKLAPKVRLVANGAARIRRRTVLEAYDPATQTEDDAKAFLDVGSEARLGVGAAIDLGRTSLAAAVTGFVPLPAKASFGTCRLFDGQRCDSLTASDYFGGAKRGDATALATASLGVRVSADVTASVMVGAGLGGARADQVLVTTGLTWTPQPAGQATSSRGDRDGDGISDAIDVCPDDKEDRDGFQDEDGCPDLDNDGDGIPDDKDKCPLLAEDKDGYQDEDGCPEPDNDGDGIPDSLDRCPNDAEDKDGFEDEDGCPDPDNDHDGFPDDKDKCPNDAETVNGFEDEDGCPDTRANVAPEDKGDRIDTKGAPVVFAVGGTLTDVGKVSLEAIAEVIKSKKLVIRVDVRAKDAATAQKRAKTIVDFLIGKGVAKGSLTSTGTAGADSVDFIKVKR